MASQRVNARREAKSGGISAERIARFTAGRRGNRREERGARLQRSLWRKRQMTGKKKRMTMELSEDLLIEVDSFVQEGKLESRDEFFERAALAELASLRRDAIDAEIALMATDMAYQEEATRIAQELAAADWEALQAGERPH
jgi:Arc/MetJ-type ribon-helix-helix transcriptional regulator